MVSLPPFRLLVLSLAMLTLSSATTDDLAPREATYKLSKNQRCGSPLGSWSKIKPDTCIPIIDTGYKILEVKGPWPVCANGAEAKVAFFWPGSKNCDPSNGNMQRQLSTKKDVMNVCTGLMVTGSFSFWCDGATIIPVTPPSKEEAKGGMVTYPGKGCKKSNKPRPEMHGPDTCIDINEGLGLEFSKDATCKNGSKAGIVGFKGKGCDPTADPLEDPYTVWQDSYIGRCIPTNDIRSMAFWCDGFDGVDLTKPRKKSGGGGKNLGLILGLSFGLCGGLLLVVGGLAVAYHINWHFRGWVQERFGVGDGYIAL